jgi:hypothetical protein
MKELRRDRHRTRRARRPPIEVATIKDATADYLADEMHTAHDINIVNRANAIVTTKEEVNSIAICSM